MKVSYKWLKELVDFDWSPEELAAKLTDAGVEVETITPLGGALERVVVGEIKAIKKHPQASKLSVCKVEIGSEFLQIVCGAANVKERAKVPVALIGAELPTGIKITKATLRGVDSFGMICSEKELGIGEDQKGIMILDSQAKIGLPVSEAASQIQRDGPINRGLGGSRDSRLCSLPQICCQGDSGGQNR
jgi:phenylalanyl-tRNA synthetase beta chain